MRPSKVGSLLLLTVTILGLFMLLGCGTPNVEQLKESGDVDGLLQALLYEGSEEGRVVPAAGEALEEMGASIVEPLIEAIGDKHERISTFAIQLLGDIKDPRAIDPLVAALDNDKLRGSALYALCRIADMRTIGVLVNYLDEDVVAEGGLVEINVKYVQPVISGQGVAAAPYRSNEPGPHPIVIADERPFADFRTVGRKGDPENWNALMPAAWQALGKPESVQLVLCWVGSEEIIIETASYGSAARGTRVRQQRSVELREAATGDVVATAVLQGAKPKVLPEIIPADRGDFTLDGGFAEDVLIDWLRPFVEGDIGG